MVLKVVGPFSVPFTKKPGGKVISDADVAIFWKLHSKYSKRRGCYTFGMRTGKGAMPGYVGKTSKSLKKEVFGLHQLNKYHQFMMEYAKGRPILFFVIAPKSAGKPNNKKIREVEKYLIDLSMTRNPNLHNKQDTNAPDWGIQGIVRGKKGKTSSGTEDFRKMLGI
jgi:hypothetical protein